MSEYKNPMHINTILMSGILKEPPKINRSRLNKQVLNFTLVNTRKFIHHETGEENEQTLIISVACWGNLVDKWKDRLKEGYFVYVMGYLKSRRWKDKEDNQKSIIEINADKIDLLDEGVDDGT